MSPNKWKSKVRSTEKELITRYVDQFKSTASNEGLMNYPLQWLLKSEIFDKLSRPIGCKLIHIFLWSRHLRSCWSKRYDYSDPDARHLTILCSYDELSNLLETDKKEKIDEYLKELQSIGLIKIIDETDEEREKHPSYELKMHVYEVEADIRLVIHEGDIAVSDLSIVKSGKMKIVKKPDD